MTDESTLPFTRGLEHPGDATLLHHRVAHRPEARDLLRREADLLRQAAGPGVLELVEFADDGAQTDLSVAWSGDRTWATEPSGSFDESLRSIVAVAATLQRMHEAGVAHGALRSDALHIDKAGRSTIAHFDEAAAVADPSPASDVAALARIGLQRAERAIALDKRLPARERRQRETALWILANPPADAGQLVDALRDATEPQRSWLRVDHVGVGVAGAVIAVSAAVLIPWLFDRYTADATTVTAPVIEVAGQRYQIGEPGDVAATADWDCDGTDNPVLLRPDTGAVFVGRDWRQPSLTAVGRVSGATGFANQPAPDCGILAVESPDGISTVVIPPRLLPQAESETGDG